MSRCVLPVFLSVLISVGSVPIAFAATNEPQLNFKIYSPEPAPSAPASETPAVESTPAAGNNESIIPAMETGASSASSSVTPAENEATAPAAAPQATTSESTATPDMTATPATPEIKTTGAAEATPETPATSTTSTTPPSGAGDTALRSETPVEAAPSKAAEAENTAPTSTTATDTAPSTTTTATETPTGTETSAATDSAATDKTANNKTLQGYIRVVPSGTKIPIIMDTAVDSETSQEGDEFTARTAEDLNIDGGVAVPAGSIIKGRIAQMNAPKHVNRSGSIALKFDTVTTPDNRQIPLVANLVAHGGVVHAKRGLKDIAIDSGTVALPMLLGLGIGALAGNTNNTNNATTTTNNNSNKIGKGEAAAIGAGIGLVVGVAILCAKKGKKVDVRPGDELKIELAEDLRMPMM